MKKYIIITVTIALLMVACKKKNNEVSPAPAPVVVKDTSVSYAVSVKPVTDKYCVSCHSTNTYIKLNSYPELKGVADNGDLNDRLFVKKDMPPSGSPKPTSAELQVISDWIKEGCKE